MRINIKGLNTDVLNFFRINKKMKMVMIMLMAHRSTFEFDDSLRIRNENNEVEDTSINQISMFS